MSEWKEFRLDELCGGNPAVIVDGPFGSNLKTSDYIESGVPVLQGMNVTNDRFNRSEVRFISTKKARELYRSNARPGDILSVKIGSVGYSALIDTLDEHEYAIIPANLLRTRVDKLIADNKFVYYLLTSSVGKQRILDIASNTAQPALSLTKFKALKFQCPSLPIQRKIACILSTIDGQIEKTEAIVAKYQAVKQGMLQDLFTRGIDVRTGELRPRYEDAPELYQDSPLGMIPKEWAVVKLYDVIEVLDSKRIPVKQEDRDKMQKVYPYYGASGVIDYVDSYLFDEDLILLGEDGENVLSRQLPLAFIAKGRYWVNNHAHVFRAKEGINVNLLTEQLEAKDYSTMASGSAQPKITQEHLKKMKVFLPNTHEQLSVMNTLSSTTKMIRADQQALAKLQLLKQGMMQDLLSGKVEVTA